MAWNKEDVNTGDRGSTRNWNVSSEIWSTSTSIWENIRAWKKET